MWRTLSLLFILPVLLLSCNGGSYVPCDTDTYHFADTSQFVSFDMNIELPADSDGIYADIRSSIIEKLIGQMASLGSYEEPHVIRPYDGDPDDILALLFTPSDDEVFYFTSIQEAAWVEQYGSLEELTAADIAFYVEQYEAIYNEAPDTYNAMFGVSSLEEFIFVFNSNQGEAAGR